MKIFEKVNFASMVFACANQRLNLKYVYLSIGFHFFFQCVDKISEKEPNGASSSLYSWQAHPFPRREESLFHPGLCEAVVKILDGAHSDSLELQPSFSFFLNLFLIR